jgi:hypothetical protein
MDHLTPAQIEKRLLQLDGENERVHEALREAESRLALAETSLRLARARALIDTFKKPEKITVQQREALVDLACEAELVELQVATTIAKAARSKVAEIKTSIDIARSLGATIRSAMDM